LFTSVLAVAAVPGIRKALEARSTGVVYVCNLRPQPPETAGFTDADHLRAVVDHGVPVQVMIAPPGARGPDEMLGVAVVRADLELADGSGHDPEKLAGVLAKLP
jgi:hypothetical protein